MDAFRKVGSEVKVALLGCGGAFIIGKQVPASTSKAWQLAYARVAREEKLRCLRLRKELPDLEEDYETPEGTEAVTTWALEVVKEFSLRVEFGDVVVDDVEEVFQRLPINLQCFQGLAILREVGALPGQFRAVAKNSSDSTDVDVA